MDDGIYSNMDYSDDCDGWDQDEFDEDDDDDYIIQEGPPPRPLKKPLPKPKVLPKHDIDIGSNRIRKEHFEHSGNQPPYNRNVPLLHSPHSNVTNANAVSDIKKSTNQNIRTSYPNISSQNNKTSRHVSNSDEENYEVQEFGKNNQEPMSGENFLNKLSFLQSKFTQNTTLSNANDYLYEVNEQDSIKNIPKVTDNVKQGTTNVNCSSVNHPMQHVASDTAHPTNPPKLGKTIIPNREGQNTDRPYPGPNSKYVMEPRLNVRNIQQNLKTISGERSVQKQMMPNPSIAPNRQGQIKDMPYPGPNSKYALEPRSNVKNVQENLKFQTPLSEERTDQNHGRPKPFIDTCNVYQPNNKEHQLSASDTPIEEEEYEVPGQVLASNSPRNVSNIRPGIPFEFNSSTVSKPFQNTTNRQGHRNKPGVDAKPVSFQNNQECLLNSISPTEDYEEMDSIPPKNVSTKDFYNYILPESPMVYPSMNKSQNRGMPLPTEELYEAVDNGIEAQKKINVLHDPVRAKVNPGMVGLAKTACNFPSRGSFSNSSSNQSSHVMNPLNTMLPPKPMIPPPKPMTPPAKTIIPPAKPMIPPIPDKSLNINGPNFIREMQQTQAQKTNKGSPTPVRKMQMRPEQMSENNINKSTPNFIAEMQISQGHGGLKKRPTPSTIPTKIGNIPSGRMEEPADNRNMQTQLSEERMFPINDLIPNKKVAPAETNKPLPRMGSANAHSVNTRSKSEEYFAVHDFSGEHGCLTFSQGDTICVTQKNGTWWHGSLNGKYGRFPADYVKDKYAHDDLFRNSWYGANMDRKVAENKLKMKSQDGGFIIRDSLKGGGYCISIYHSGSFTHLRMPLKDGYYYLGDSGTQKFATISELVTYYSAHIINLKTGTETMLMS